MTKLVLLHRYTNFLNTFSMHFILIIVKELEVNVEFYFKRLFQT